MHREQVEAAATRDLLDAQAAQERKTVVARERKAPAPQNLRKGAALVKTWKENPTAATLRKGSVDVASAAEQQGAAATAGTGPLRSPSSIGEMSHVFTGAPTSISNPATPPSSRSSIFLPCQIEAVTAMRGMPDAAASLERTGAAAPGKGKGVVIAGKREGSAAANISGSVASSTDGHGSRLLEAWI